MTCIRHFCAYVVIVWHADYRRLNVAITRAKRVSRLAAVLYFSACMHVHGNDFVCGGIQACKHTNNSWTFLTVWMLMSLKSQCWKGIRWKGVYYFTRWSVYTGFPKRRLLPNCQGRHPPNAGFFNLFASCSLLSAHALCVLTGIDSRWKCGHVVGWSCMGGLAEPSVSRTAMYFGAGGQSRSCRGQLLAHATKIVGGMVFLSWQRHFAKCDRNGFDAWRCYLQREDRSLIFF